LDAEAEAIKQNRLDFGCHLDGFDSRAGYPRQSRVAVSGRD
jgi:hypothetical protein